jgi:hypothetical protein
MRAAVGVTAIVALVTLVVGGIRLIFGSWREAVPVLVCAAFLGAGVGLLALAAWGLDGF